MKILLDLVHPAHALFFHHAITVLEEEGATVAIASRDKDVLLPLLDGLGHPHRVLTVARTGIFGLARELLERDFRLWRLGRRFRPEVMASCGGVSIAHAGKLLGIPSLSFYDTEHASLQNRLAIPFVTEWHVQESWTGPKAKGRTFHFPGTRHSAYLHPDHFVPDPERAQRAGWEPGRDNFMVRLVAWKAGHDIGKSGITADELRAAIAFLSAHGRVHVSAEGALPDEFEPFRYRGSVLDFHHLLAHCQLCFGESATVSTEAVTLGIPAVFYCELEYGYIRQQEEAGLIRHVRPGGASPVEAIEASLALNRENYRRRARAFVSAKGDLNRYVVDAIRAAPKRYRRSRGMLLH